MYLIYHRGPFLSSITANNVHLWINSEKNQLVIGFFDGRLCQNTLKLNKISYMVDPPILNCINDFDSVMASTRCTKNGASPFMNIIYQFRCQLDGIARVEAFITTLHNKKITYY